MTGEKNATSDRVAIPFTHHSHSGQFCGHAIDALADCIESAIAKGMHTICLTEHIPRELTDFYPEEDNVHDEASLRKLFDDFYHEATQMQKRYAGRIQILVGFESEWIRPSTHGIVKSLLEMYAFDMFVGSLHHVHTVPIDYDLAMYQKARAMAGGSDEKLFLDYFDSQFEMLQALRPPIVGHFDLIRLKSDAPNLGLKTLPTVWDKILRNLDFVARYGGVLELNSSAIRKGMDEAYPQIDICKEFLGMGGRFTVSDDSHGVGQVGACYDEVLDCVQKCGITELWFLVLTERGSPKNLNDTRFPSTDWRKVDVLDLSRHADSS